MTLPASGSISIAQVATELGIGATGLSLNDSRVRNLFGKASGIISMSDGRGKSNNYVGSFVVGNSGVNSGRIQSIRIKWVGLRVFKSISWLWRPDITVRVDCR